MILWSSHVGVLHFEKKWAYFRFRVISNLGNKNQRCFGCTRNTLCWNFYPCKYIICVLCFNFSTWNKNKKYNHNFIRSYKTRDRSYASKDINLEKFFALMTSWNLKQFTNFSQNRTEVFCFLSFDFSWNSGEFLKFREFLKVLEVFECPESFWKTG